MTVAERRLRIATRGSALARWQATCVADQLRRAHPDLDVELVVLTTHADQRLDIPIAELGGKGVFVKEIQAALLDGRADVAVHSAKDLPSMTVDGLVLAAIPERGEVRDALVGAALADLREGACVGTGSQRRRVQLAHLRPDLRFSELRGNMATRLARAVDFDAIVVAAVALQRLGLGAQITEVLDERTLLPQVGQGALAVECRAGDGTTAALLAPLDHAPSRRRVEAERGFLATLGGDCNLPAGACAVIEPDGRLRLDALLASPDGSVVLRHRAIQPIAEGATTAEEFVAPVVLGVSAARHLLAESEGRW